MHTFPLLDTLYSFDVPHHFAQFPLYKQRYGGPGNCLHESKVASAILTVGIKKNENIIDDTCN